MNLRRIEDHLKRPGTEPALLIDRVYPGLHGIPLHLILLGVLPLHFQHQRLAVAEPDKEVRKKLPASRPADNPLHHAEKAISRRGVDPHSAERQAVFVYSMGWCVAGVFVHADVAKRNSGKNFSANGETEPEHLVRTKTRAGGAKRSENGQTPTVPVQRRRKNLTRGSS